jgi:hypothetical protein
LIRLRAADSTTIVTPMEDFAAALGTAGEAAGVTRQTVSSWVNHHPGFQAALNARRRELLDRRADAIRHADGLALSLVVDALDRGDVEVAARWLQARRLSEVDTARIGPVDVQAVVQTRVDALRMAAG